MMKRKPKRSWISKAKSAISPSNGTRSTVSEVEEKFAIGSLGSCRIHTPLTLANDLGHLKFKTDSVIGYVHNPFEIIQAIKLLRGDFRAPSEIFGLMSVNAPDKLGDDDRFYRLFANVEALILEISSVRIINYNGWQIQINRFRELMAKFGVAEREVGKLFSEGFDKSAILELLTAPDAGLARSIVSDAKFYELDETELVSVLTDLRKMIAEPVIFVGFFENDFDGNPIPQRVNIRNALIKVCKENKETYFVDPNILIAQHGSREILLDLGHYKPEFEPVVADFLGGVIADIGGGSKGMQTLRDRRLLREARRTNAAVQ